MLVAKRGKEDSLVSLDIVTFIIEQNLTDVLTSCTVEIKD